MSHCFTSLVTSMDVQTLLLSMCTATPSSYICRRMLSGACSASSDQISANLGGNLAPSFFGFHILPLRVAVQKVSLLQRPS